MNQRLFIASAIPDDIKKDILKTVILPKNFKVTSIENIHLTYLFLGDTDPSLITKISDSLENCLSKKNSFDLEINSFGQFPEIGYPRIIFLTGIKGLEELKNVADLIRESMKKFGFTDRKDFKYHITVARCKENFKRERFKLPDLEKNYRFTLNEVTLYNSQLTPKGPIYTAIKTIRLK